MSAESTHPVVNGNQMYIAERKVCDTRNVKEYCNECATDVMVVLFTDTTVRAKVTVST